MYIKIECTYVLCLVNIILKNQLNKNPIRPIFLVIEWLFNFYRDGSIIFFYKNKY